MADRGETLSPQETILAQIGQLREDRRVATFNLATALANSCGALTRIGRGVDALSNAREAYALLPESAHVRQNYRLMLEICGSDFYNRDDIVQAVTCFTEGLAAFPDSPALQFGMAMLTANRSIYEAAEYAVTAWTLDQQNIRYFQAAWHMMTMFTSVYDTDWTADPDIYRRKCEGTPSYVTLIAFAIACGDPVAAETALRQAIAQSAELPFAFLLLGTMLGRGERIDEAAHCFDRVKQFPVATVERMIHLDRAFHRQLLDWTFQCRMPRLGSPTHLPQTVAYVLFCGCDIGYWRRFGAAFVASFKDNAEGGFLHLHITNPDEEFFRRTPEMLDSTLGQRYCVTHEFFDDTKVEPTRAAAYFSCNRVHVFADMLRFYRRTMILLDIDILIKAPLIDVCRQYDGHDIALPLNPWATPAEHYAIGIMVVRPNANTQRLFDRVSRYIDWHWHAERRCGFSTRRRCTVWSGPASTPISGRASRNSILHRISSPLRRRGLAFSGQLALSGNPRLFQRHGMA